MPHIESQEDMAQTPPLLTIAELAKRHELPESTARFYCKRFLEYLPHVGQGKRRRYRPEVLPIFSFILGEMKKRKDARIVEAALASRYPKAAPAEQIAPPSKAASGPDPSGQHFATVMKLQGKALESVADALAGISRRDAETEEIKSRLDTVEQALAEIKEQLAELRAMQDQAESIHQQDLEQLRKWLAQLAQAQTQGK